jgi:choline dehydrogenase-like flavoprotein
MADTPERYDIAIIGSGISGSSLGAILARHGLRVIIFEAGTHPKFAVGESMILETSETMRAMAELFAVPELAYFSSENYLAHIGTSHGVKRHFSYLHHSEGQPQNLRRSLQAVIPQRPHGYELHIHRQDSDYLLTSLAVRYGATVLQSTPVKDAPGPLLPGRLRGRRRGHALAAGREVRLAQPQPPGALPHDLHSYGRPALLQPGRGEPARLWHTLSRLARHAAPHLPRRLAVGHPLQ